MKKIIGDAFMQLNKSDLIKGVIMTILVSVVAAVHQALQSEPPQIPTLAELAEMGKVGLLAGFTYLIKNFFTNSDDKFARRESK